MAGSRSRVSLHGGVDEAGLGPTLGPLVIAAFATQGPQDLALAMAAAFGGPRAQAPLLAVGDSKEIYSGAHKLARLERSALATWMWVNEREHPPANARALMNSVCAEVPPDESAPWFAEGSSLDLPLPRACDPAELSDTVERLDRVARAAGVRPVLYRGDVISAKHFNREMRDELELGGTKNTWVVARTLALVGEVANHPLATCGAGAELLCDKAGGRDDYMRPLARAFPERVADEVLRSRARSDYTLHGLLERCAHLNVSFAMKADRLDARVGLASCLAKYLRELTMHAFNSWFAKALSGDTPGLRPTAGYPQDARRFIAQVEHTSAVADMPRSTWIRER